MPAALAPTITTPPANLTVIAGSPAGFSVTATGTAPLHYQWKVGSTTIGTDAATLSLPATALSDAGSYTVTISNVAGSATSNAATLVVQPPLKRIVYERTMTVPGGTGTQRDLYAVNEDGTGEVALATSQSDEALAIEPNSGSPVRVGDRIIYRRIQSLNAEDLYSVKVDGTGTVPLAASSWLMAVFGDRLVIRSRNGGFSSMNADGTSPGQFPSDAGYVGAIQGRVLYNSALATGTGRLYSALPDGSGAIELWDHPAFGMLLIDLYPRNNWVPLTAGDRVFFRGLQDPVTFGFQVYTCRVDGTGKALLTANADNVGAIGSDQHYSYATFQVAGDRFVYQVLLPDGTSSIYSVKLDGTATVLLTPTSLSNGAVFTGAIGTRVFFKQYGPAYGIYTLDAATGNPTRISTGDVGPVSGSRLILFKNPSTSLGSYCTDISSVLPDGTFEAALSTQAFDAGGFFAGVVGEARLQQVGNRIFFRKLVGTTTANSLDIFSINNDGTGLATLASGGETYAEFLGPDRLYFRRVVNAQADLYSVLHDGTGLVTLANGATEERFGLMAGSKVVFTRKGLDGHRNLYIVNADGTGEVALSTSPEDKNPVAAF